MKRNNYIYYGVIVLFVLFLSIGYSAFNKKLTMSDIGAAIRVEKDVRITGINLVGTETSNDTSATYDYNVSSISTDLTLPTSTSYVTFEVEVLNIANAEVGILNISNLPSNLKYELVNYNLEDKICDDAGKCNLGIRKKFKIKISYTGTGFDGNTSFSFKLDFDFREFHKVTYNNVSGTSLPTEVIDGGTLIANIGSADSNNLIVKMDGVQTLFYTYQNNILTVPNVNGELDITFSDSTIMKKIIVDANTSSGNVSDLTKYDFDNMTQTEKTEKFSKVASENGLYRVKGITGNSDALVYRGDITNNYVRFSGHLWRILQVDEDGNLRLILNDVISTTSNYKASSTATSLDAAKTLLTYSSSNAKTVLDSFYTSDLSSNTDKIIKSKFCVNFDNYSRTSSGTQATVYYFQSYENIGVDSAIYTPSLVCPSNYIVEDNIGLISAEEVVLAGGAYNVSNTNYFLYNSAISSYYWTLSPAYYDSGQNNANVFAVGSNGLLTDWTANLLNNSYYLRPVITINGNLEMSGNGTRANPFVYKDSSDNPGTEFKTGDKVQLGNDQDFYVVHSDKDTTLLFAAYNLNVGSAKNSSVTTGIQGSSVRGWVMGSTNYGYSSYYDTQGDATSGTTTLNGYLSSYKSYLESTFNIAVRNIDLLSRNLAVNYLGMDLNSGLSSSSAYYTWFTYTTFWFKEEANMNGYVYYIDSQGSYSKANDTSGIRPLIEVSTQDLGVFLANS